MENMQFKLKDGREVNIPIPTTEEEWRQRENVVKMKAWDEEFVEAAKKTALAYASGKQEE